MLLFCVGNVQVRLGQFVGSRECLLPLLGREDLLPLHRPHVLDTIAWANLMRGDPGLLEETDQFSKEAYEAVPWSSYFAGTRGAVLVDLGQTEAGMELLRTALKKNKDAYNKAANACYLALGEAKLGNADAARKHLEMARELDAKCPVLERIAENVQNASIN
jgi:tetratricopeptide (TPR) repeat protein